MNYYLLLTFNLLECMRSISVSTRKTVNVKKIEQDACNSLLTITFPHVKLCLYRSQEGLRQKSIRHRIWRYTASNSTYWREDVARGTSHIRKSVLTVCFSRIFRNSHRYEEQSHWIYTMHLMHTFLWIR